MFRARDWCQMVVVGHSMGDLLSKMIAADAGDRLWRVVSDGPFGELAGEKDDREHFRNGLFFGARPEVRLEVVAKVRRILAE